MGINQADLELEIVDCPACGSSASKIWMDDGKPTSYVRCEECGTIYASPRSPWKQRYAWLDQSFSYGDNAIRNSNSRLIGLKQEALLLQAHIKRGRLLDIGCDLGDFFQWFPGSEWERYGAEISPSAAEYASQTYGATVYPGTIHQFQFPAHSFDLVTILDTFYYVDNPDKDIEEIGRLLKPGGILAIEISGQNYQMLRSRGLLCWLVEKRWTRIQTDSSYINWFTPQGLEQLLNKNGFECFKFYLIGSPVSSSFLRNILTGTYLKFLSASPKRSFRLLNWAPKYMILARRAAEETLT